MRQGVYRARFETAGDIGEGVIVLDGSRIRGGDGSIAYSGTYKAHEDGTVTADVKADIYATKPGMESVFGRNKNRIRFEGKRDGDTALLVGRSDQAPGIELQVRIDFVME